ncbi:MAG: hypothetical protein AABX02_03480 [archaeon]
MNFLTHKWKILGILAVLALIPVAYSTIYPGGNTPVTFTNTDLNGPYVANLIGYGDHNTQCLDFPDKGFKPLIPSFMQWADPTDVNFPGGPPNIHNQGDACLDANTLLEVGCIEHFKVNGVQHSKYVIGAAFNCKNISPTSTCVMNFNQLGRCT